MYVYCKVLYYIIQSVILRFVRSEVHSRCSWVSLFISHVNE